MPYSIRRDSDACSTTRPYAVVKTADGEIMGCHENPEKARDQIVAIESSERDE